MNNTAVDLSTIISIHALREESDAMNNTAVDLSTIISIHALREESDWSS